MRIAIVGAGVGGLAAAHRLQRLSEQRHFPLEIVVLEASGRAGGVVGTEAHAGALIERGPDSLVTHKPAGLALCRELGLGDQVVHPAPGGTDILLDGRLLPVPAGFALLAPSRLRPILESPLLGWAGKLRALGEPLIPKADAAANGDESVASFVRRRFGAELLERVAEPIVGAIYMADVERLSLRATFPRFLDLEREHGSVVRGLRRAGARRADGGANAAPPVATLAGGIGRLVDTLVARLPAGALRLNRRAVRLRRERDGFALQLEDGESLGARAVLLALPAHAAAPLLVELDSALAEPMAAIAYASCATVHLAWPRHAVARPPRSLGFFVPGSAGSALVAAGFVHVKFPGRVQDEQIVTRLFLGGARAPAAAELPDAELVALATGAIAPLLGAREPADWSVVHRHARALPQPAVGHLELVERLRARLGNHLGLELAGGPVGAYGLPDVIAAGEAAAARLFERMVARGDAR